MDDLTATQVAERLGVEMATVYAYVSRGALTRRTGPDGRTSRYDADEVEALAQRARPRSSRRSPGAVDVVIGTTVSEIGDGWIKYRGHDLMTLAGHHPFESVARLLWTGELDGPSAVDSAARRSVERAAVASSSALPADAPVWARLAVAAVACEGLLPEVTDDAGGAGQLIVDAMVASLPLVGRPVPVGTGLAARLWVRCSALAPTRRRVAALDLALSLLAEHELATSTLAVRVAASTGASPAASVLAGVGAVSGPLHGGAAGRVQRRLEAATTTVAPATTVAPTVTVAPATTAAPAGFGHPVHVHGDPRFAPLQRAVAEMTSPSRALVIDADLAAHAHDGTPPPNIDAALGAWGYVARATPGATDAVFTIARTAGWLAHAFEEADETPLRYRGRTVSRSR